MRVSLIIAAHNEGPALWKTVASCVETCGGLNYEIVVADDASFDDSIADLRRRFPQVRIVAVEERQGASPTKDHGARQARGDVLVFLDGHCKPEEGAVRRLVESVEQLHGEAIITPAVAALDVERWKSSPRQIGHGYFVELEDFHCGWLPLSELNKVQEKRRLFYESPALIGCALALSRELYDDLRGFDVHMRIWGVEDLDFGLKCWLMGHRILHDPEAVVGHRFRRAFDNYSVPVAQIAVNQLRMARKNFTDGVWSAWLTACRERRPGALPEHPEGLWAQIWELFLERRESVEHERSYLLARRKHDEFWFAEKFNLAWPRLKWGQTVAPPGEAGESRTFAAMQGSPSPLPSPSPSPPPCDCEVTGVAPETVTIGVNESQSFTAQGDNLDDVEWSTSSDAQPDEGTGSSFSTQWSEPGHKTVTASCCESSEEAKVTVVKVEITDPDGTPITEPQTVMVGQKIELVARITPSDVVPTAESWTIPGHPGHAIRNYTQTLGVAWKEPLESFDLDHVSVRFYWIAEMASAEVKYTATINGKQFAASVLFEVKRPNSTLTSTITPLMPPTDTRLVSGQFWFWMLFGDLVLGETGIAWEAHVTTPIGGAGEIAFVQLVIVDGTEITNDDVRETMSSNGLLILDDGPLNYIRYDNKITPVASDATEPHKSHDVPGNSLPDTLKRISVDHQFALFLMYKPEGEGSIWVTLRRLNWHWTASARRIFGAIWDMEPGQSPADDSNPPGSVDSMELPEWQDYASHLPWLPD